MKNSVLDPPAPTDKKHYDLWVIGLSIAFIIITLIVANNVKWVFKWNPQGVSNLIATAGALFVIALAIERYIKIFLVDSPEEDEINNLRKDIQALDKKYSAEYQEYLVLKRDIGKAIEAEKKREELWLLEARKIQLQQEVRKILITRKERLRLISFAIGCSIAILGLPLLKDLILITDANEPDETFITRILQCLDVLLIGALISGGSAAISTFFEAIKSRI